jgi:hypothetical protein
VIQKNNKMATVFESRQASCWSADKCGVQSELVYDGYWIVNFKQGQILEAVLKKQSVTANWPTTSTKNETNYVKAVRTAK